MTYRHQRDAEETENQALELVLDNIDHVRNQFDPTAIFNTDQSGFNYIVHSNRTLSQVGERFTVAAAQSMNKLTHSYTIQPILTMNGNLVEKLFIILQERNDALSPRQQQTIPSNCKNLHITCSLSGKITNQLFKVWRDEDLAPVVNNPHDKKCALYVDSLSTQKEAAKYHEGGLDVTLKVFPKGSTSLVQPLDIYCFRQWKDFAKRITQQCAFHGFRVDQRADAHWDENGKKS